MDAVTWDLFSGFTTVYKQLREWACRGVTSILEAVPPHAYPELFVELLSRALVNVNERATELEHLKVKTAATRGQRYVGKARVFRINDTFLLQRWPTASMRRP